MHQPHHPYTSMQPKITLRKIQRLPMTPFSLLLRKEYFDCPQRDSHAVHYKKKRGDRGVFTLVLCSLASVMSCIKASVGIATKKIPDGETSIYIIHLCLPAYHANPRVEGGRVWVGR